MDREGAVVSFCENKNFTNADEMKNILGQALSDEANQRLSQANKTHLTHFSKFANNICSLRKIALSVQRGQVTGFASEINPADYVQDTYGTEGGIKEKYFKFVENESGNYVLNELDSSENSDFKVIYSPANYEQATEPLNDNLTPENVKDKLFEGFSGSPVINIRSDFSDIDVVSDFVGNTNLGSAQNGIIYIWRTSDKLNSVIGTFINNEVNRLGGGINVHGKLNTITGDYINNKAGEHGGAINNWNNGAIINNINGNFVGNSAVYGGAIATQASGEIKNLRGYFVGNYASLHGGAVYANKINDLESDFYANYSYEQGGALWITGGAKIGRVDEEGKVIGGGIVNSKFVDNFVLSNDNSVKGGAIYNDGTEISGGIIAGITNSLFQNNFSKSTNNDSYGGGIYSYGTIGVKDDEGNLTGGIVNSNFYSNYAKSESSVAQGGAIYTAKDLNIIADNGTSVFKDNYVQVGDGEKDYQAIWVEGANTKLNLQQFNNGKMYMYDNINGTNGYTVNLQGDGTGTLYLYNDIKNANVTVDNTTINTANGEIHAYNFNSFHIISNFNFEPDVDLVNEKMDRITSENITVADGAKLNVSKLHLMNDATKNITKITFADNNLANHVEYTGEKFISYSPIYKYETSYNIEQDENGNPLGRFTFLRSSTSNSESFNPSVLATPVATTAGVYATQLHTFGESFQHSDNYMAMTNSDRTVYKNSNRYAQEGISDVNVFSPLMSASENRGYWVKPYATFERVPLRHGPKVSNIAYGTLIGYDTALTPIKHGFDRVMTYYVGYNGSTQHYNGIDGYQNGGVIGTTISLYKGNFFNATTVSVGASVGEMTTMYGHDYFTSLLAGIGNKTGYNFEFRGKLGNKLGTTFTLQPNLFIGYTYIKTFDYTNKAGVRIESDPMSAIQISQGIKFIANTKKGWQPYFAINMVWNIFAHNKVMANDVRLPNMSIAPYVQYGLGVQKRFKDRFIAFAQAMVHNGGRNGVALSLGLRWTLGK